MSSTPDDPAAPPSRSPPPAAHAEVRRSSWVSIAWIVPLVAALLGLSLVYRTVAEKGPEIQIVFPDATGIEAGKTTVKLKAVEIGLVRAVELAEDLQSVVATAELHKGAERYLNEQTVFWLVRPRVGFSEISGLETVLSGQYIELIPGAGAPTRRFDAHQSPPVQTRYPKAKVVVLETSEVGTISPGVPVYFRGVQVGEVASLRAVDDGPIEVLAVVDQEYAAKVRGDSRFWNASGVDMRVGLDGVSVRAEGIKAVLGGGIAFDTPRESRAEEAPSLARFPLYPGLEAARLARRRAASVRIALVSDSARGIAEGAAVLYRNVRVGEIGGRRLAADARTVVQDAYVEPAFAKLVRTDTRFWKVRGLEIEAGIDGLRAHVGALGEIVTGGVALAVPDPPGPIAVGGTRFVLHEAPRPEWLEWAPRIALRAGNASPAPADENAAPAPFRLVLVTDDAGAVRAGAPVTHRGVRIGELGEAVLAIPGGGDAIEIPVSLDPRFAALVTARTRFWSVEGISAELGLSGLRIDAPPARALLTGEVRFETPEGGEPVAPGRRFRLHRDRTGAVAESATPPLRIHVEAAASAVGSGSPLLHRGHRIGVVSEVALTREAYAVRITLEVEPRYARLIRSTSRFWSAEPFDVALGLTGVRVSAAPLRAVVAGGIMMATPPGDSRPAVQDAVFDLGVAPDGWQAWRPAVTLIEQPAAVFAREAPNGLRLELTGAEVGSIRAGQRVLYRGVPVGAVGAPALGPEASSVRVPVTIEPAFARLVRANTRFWNVSGVRVNLGLSGLQIGAASIETLLRGGIAFATPEPPGEPVVSGTLFLLHADPPAPASAPAPDPDRGTRPYPAPGGLPVLPPNSVAPDIR